MESQKRMAFSYTISQDDTSNDSQFRKKRFLALCRDDKSLDFKKAFGSTEDCPQHRGLRPPQNLKSSSESNNPKPHPTTSSNPRTQSDYPESPFPFTSPDLHPQITGVPEPDTNPFGWVSYRPDPASHRLVPVANQDTQRRKVRGRRGPLRAEQRREAARVRLLRACTNCKQRKVKCDAGTPCKPCLDYYKGDLAKFSCSRREISVPSPNLTSSSGTVVENASHGFSSFNPYHPLSMAPQPPRGPISANSYDVFDPVNWMLETQTAGVDQSWRIGSFVADDMRTVEAVDSQAGIELVSSEL